MRDDTPAPLGERERALLDGILGEDFVGVAALREQVRTVQATKACDCGCGTIDLVVADPDARRSEAPSPVPVEGRVTDAAGKEVGGLLLFVDDGMLANLEIYSFGEPLPLPDLEQVRWVCVPR